MKVRKWATIPFIKKRRSLPVSALLSSSTWHMRGNLAPLPRPELLNEPHELPVLFVAPLVQNRFLTGLTFPFAFSH